MTAKTFKVFVVIVLLSLPNSGQNSQQHLICKNVGSFFSDGHDDSPVSQPRRFQARTGKRGPAGAKGEHGLPGVKGEPGTRAVVDYDRIFQVIQEKHRAGMREMEYRFEELKRNITQFERELEQRGEQATTATTSTTTTSMTTDQARGQRCQHENGLIYDGKCYYAYISYPSRINFKEAIQKCRSRNSVIAELHSLAHQKAIQDFFRSRIPSPRHGIELWLGMTYQSSERNLRFRSGKEVSTDQLKWLTNYPNPLTYVNIVIEIRNDGQDEGIYNTYLSNNRRGAICEKPL